MLKREIGASNIYICKFLNGGAKLHVETSFQSLQSGTPAQKGQRGKIYPKGNKDDYDFDGIQSIYFANCPIDIHFKITSAKATPCVE